MMIYFEKRKLIKFRENIEKNKKNFPPNYMEIHKTRLEWLDWLIASYYGRTGGKPKELLESLMGLSQYSYMNHLMAFKELNMTPKSEAEILKEMIELMNFLYHWVYHKEIIGF